MAKKIRNWDEEHSESMKRYAYQIRMLFNTLAKEAAAIGTGLNHFNPNKPFSFADYPATKKRADKLIQKAQKDMQTIIVNGVEASWTLSNNKNSELARQIFGSSIGRLKQDQYRRYFSNNDKAREAFLLRKVNGLNLSDRVWKYTSQFKDEIEMGLDVSIRNGVPANKMASDLKRYLQHPDMLFRRVRDEHGQLHLSRRAAAFHPGRGVYRSSQKNAERLARTETNIAYRTADHDRWQDMDFVVGYEIKLSNNPNHCPVCATLAGRYPKNFKFTGWHPNCRCRAIPILKTLEEFEAETKAILAGEDTNTKSINEIAEMPANFTRWYGENQSRFRGSSKPLWLSENARIIEKSNPKTLSSAKKLDMSKIIKGDKVGNKEVKDVLIAYSGMFPDDFRKGLEAVSVRKSRSYMMQHSMKYNPRTNEWASGSSLTVSTNSFNIGGKVFNPAEELKGAFLAIKNNKELSFNQEYAIESLWHEILHAKTKTKPSRLSGYTLERMETVNQFVARHSYDQFLQRLGGKAIHKEKILSDGYGYSTWITNFRKELKKRGIPEATAIKELEPTLMSDYSLVWKSINDMYKKYEKTK